MTWNKKNQQFALSCGLRRSTLEVCQYILRRTKPGQIVEIEIDLRVINRWLGKYRPQGEYDRKTIKEALRQLDEFTQGWILVTKTYTWAIHKILVRPLDMVLESNSQIGDKVPKLKTANPMFDGDRKKRVIEQQQQDISKLDNLFQKVGLKYGRDALARIWRLAGKNMDEVCNSIELLLHRHSFGRTEIPNPHGFIIDCLKYGWYWDSELSHPAELPIFDGISALVNAVNRLRVGESPGIGGYKT